MLEFSILAALGLLGAFALIDMTSDDDSRDDARDDEEEPGTAPIPGDEGEEPTPVDPPVRPPLTEGQIGVEGSGDWAGTDGPDTFVNTGDLPLENARIEMGRGNDTFKGDANHSSFHGGDGRDVIQVRGDHNQIHGGNGNDRLWAAGFDGGVMNGDGGNDRLYVDYTSQARVSGVMQGGEGNNTITASVELNNDPDHAPLIIDVGGGENVVNIHVRDLNISHEDSTRAGGVRVVDFDPEFDRLILTLSEDAAADFESLSMRYEPAAQLAHVYLSYYHDAGQLDGSGDYRYSGVITLEGAHLAGLRASDIEIQGAPWALAA